MYCNYTCLVSYFIDCRVIMGGTTDLVKPRMSPGDGLMDSLFSPLTVFWTVFSPLIWKR